MKKLSSFLMVALMAIVTLTSCGDNEPKPDKASIVGSWKLESAVMTVGDMSQDMSGMTGELEISFNEDGTCTFDGDVANYTHEGNTLTLTYADEEETYSETMTVDKLTKNELVLSETQSEEGMTATITLTFSRVA